MKNGNKIRKLVVTKFKIIKIVKLAQNTNRKILIADTGQSSASNSDRDN